jgi:hypothetical protein
MSSLDWYFSMMASHVMEEPSSTTTTSNVIVEVNLVKLSNNSSISSGLLYTGIIKEKYIFYFLQTYKK